MGPIAKPFIGTIPVREIDTHKMLSLLRRGSDFTIVAAHRALWVDNPENSASAIAAAYDSGIEAVEIDIRVASDQLNPLKEPIPPDTEIVLSHDECLDRTTSGTGTLSRLNPHSPCSPDVGVNVETFRKLFLRQRDGTISSEHPVTFTDALAVLQNYLSVDEFGRLRGPIMLVDIKDRDYVPRGPNSPFYAWSEYKLCLKQMRMVLKNPAFYAAVVFKMKFNSGFPSVQVLSDELASHPSYGHIMFTIVPEDAVHPDWGPASANFQQVQALSNAVSGSVPQFEFVPYNTVDRTDTYLRLSPGNETLLGTFSTYYQPNTFPEGVSTRFGMCCAQAAVIRSETPGGSYDEVDVRGIPEFTVYYESVTSARIVSLITTDNVEETLSLLIAKGARNVSRIR